VQVEQEAAVWIDIAVEQRGDAPEVLSVHAGGGGSVRLASGERDDPELSSQRDRTAHSHRQRRRERSSRFYRGSSMRSLRRVRRLARAFGLFVAKQLVEGHGGRITIESSKGEKEHGTIAHVFLPSVTSYAKS